MKVAANASIMDVAVEMAGFLQNKDVSKYGLSFFYQGQALKLSDRLGDKQVGATSKEDNTMLCVKGGDNSPKKWCRMTHQV